MISFYVQKRRDGNRRNVERLHANLQLDLQELLGGLVGYSSVSRLSSLPIYDDTYIEGEWLNGLMLDLASLEDRLAGGSPGFRIPDEVGVTSDEDLRTDFGVRGFLQWVRDLRNVCELAKERDVPVWAAGD